MPNELPLVQIDLTPQYRRNLRELSKKYRNPHRYSVDYRANTSGRFCRKPHSGVGEDYVILKVRVKNSNIQKGKSYGYRLIYQVESSTSILLLTIYSKSDREDINNNEIIAILSEFYERDR